MPRANFKRGGGGGGRGRGRGRGKSKGGGPGHRQFQDNRKSEQFDKNNEKFERFYNSIGIVPDDGARECFWEALRRELPNSFRFTGSKGHALSVRDNLVQRYFPLIEKIKHDGQPVKLPTAMPWYPNGLAYRMDTPKNVVRKYEPFKDFQKFLVSETGVGNISRQEEVSMIPPFLLDIQSHHTVLDLCAAPGSKSAQLIEMIHAGEEERVTRAIQLAKIDGQRVDTKPEEDGGRATGMLVANDNNYQRAQMLVHQVKRLNSPNLIVTNHDATMFPSIALQAEPSPGKPPKGKYLKFDRILADVPCSGDGTCRKNPNIWKDWAPQNGLGLYITQVRILTRALQMLKVGGRVVYSTCSMNPVENEAVVASAIERCGGAAKVKLLDCSDRLPGLIRNPGLTDWSIMNRNGQMYESWPEAEQFEDEGSRIVPGMFAPDPEENIRLENCWRVYPHQQDTGGFFIAALEKLSEIRAKSENESKSGNRRWKFVAPDSAPAPVEVVPMETNAPTATAFDDLLSEVAHPATGPTTNSDLPSSSVTSAQRQNDSNDNHAETRTKRPAPADEDASGPTKKSRVEDESATVSSVNGVYEEPDSASSTAFARTEAQVLETSAENVSSDTVSTTVSRDEKDAVNEAPFEKSVPSQVIQQPKKRKDDPVNEESFKYLAPDHPEMASIYDFYDLHPLFPRDRFLVRNPAGDPVKGIYYSSQVVKDVLVQNEGRGMKFVHAGVKMFMKQDAQGQNICRWRIQTEGLPLVEGWVGESRVVHLTRKDTLRKLLLEMFPRVPTIKHEDGSESGGWMDLGEIGKQIKDRPMGCCLMRVEASPELGDAGFKESFTMPLWRSLHSVNLMLPKEDRKAMLLRLYNEEAELINHTDPKQNGKSSGQGRHAGTTNGSIPAEDDSKELEEKFHRNDTIDGEDSMEGNDDTPILPVSEQGAMALEQGLVSTRDHIESKRLEVLEDENRKVAEAMPERDGEGDDYNTTV